MGCVTIVPFSAPFDIFFLITSLSLMVTVIQYKFPPEAYQVLFLLSMFLYVDQARPNTIGARIRQFVGGPSVMDKIRQLTIGIHVIEALVMLFVNVRRGASLSVTVRAPCMRFLSYTLILHADQVDSDNTHFWRSVLGHIREYV